MTNIHCNGDIYTCGWIEVTDKPLSDADKKTQKEKPWLYLEDVRFTFDRKEKSITIVDNNSDDGCRTITRFDVSCVCERAEKGYYYTTYWFKGV